MAAMVVLDWQVETRDSWMFVTTFDLDTDDWVYQFPHDAEIPGLTNEAKELVGKIMSIPGVMEISVARKQLVIVTKSEDFDWETVVWKVRQAFSEIYSLGLQVYKRPIADTQ